MISAFCPQIMRFKKHELKKMIHFCSKKKQLPAIMSLEFIILFKRLNLAFLIFEKRGKSYRKNRFKTNLSN